MNTDVQVQVTGDASGIMAQIWQAVTPVVVDTIDAALSPATIAAVLVAWAITHGVKLWLKAFRPKIAAHPARYRFCVYAASVVSGALAGLACAPWIGLAGAGLVALLNGIVWRVVVAIPIPYLRHALTTQTDRRLMGIE